VKTGDTCLTKTFSEHAVILSHSYTYTPMNSDIESRSYA